MRGSFFLCIAFFLWSTLGALSRGRWRGRRPARAVCVGVWAGWVIMCPPRAPGCPAVLVLAARVRALSESLSGGHGEGTERESSLRPKGKIEKQAKKDYALATQPPVLKRPRSL